MTNLRYAFRLLVRAPGFTFAALLALALATGANTAVFSLVYSVLLRPLPFPEPSRLVSITQFFPSFNQSAITGPDYLDWRDGIGRTARIAAYSQADYTLANANLTEPIPAAMVSHEFFEVLGVHPIAGRAFSAADDSPGNDAVAVISEGFWNERLGRDPGFAGSRIALDGRSYQIIGVMPAWCAFPPAARVWLPLALDPVRERQGGPMNLVRVIGRLAAGTTETGLTSTLSAISRRSAQGFGAGSRVAAQPLRSWLTGKTRQVWFVLMGAVGLLLLIACANVAGLLMARGEGRRREMAIRVALGAPAGRLVRQLLTESLLLGIGGSAIGLALAAILVRGLLPLIPSSMLAGRPVALDGPVFVFTALVAIITPLVFGLAPAGQAARGGVAEPLKNTRLSSVGGAQLRSALIAAEIALGLALLVTAGLMVRSLVALSYVDPGFRADHALTFVVNLPNGAYREPARQAQFLGNALTALQALAGVQAAGLISALPFSGATAGRALFSTEGEPPWDAGMAGNQAERHRVDALFVSADYFPAMGIPLLSGRSFSTAEMTRDGGPVIVNAAFARRFFGDIRAAGRRIKAGLPEAPNPWLTIVGVVADSKRTGLDEDSSPTVYRPFQQSRGMRIAGFVVRTAADPAAMTRSATNAVGNIDRAAAISDIQTMESRVAGSLAPTRLRSVAAGLMAALALVIVMTGLYGVLSFIVSQRTAELGVRIALGATAAGIFTLVLRRAAMLAAFGVLAGVALSLAASQFLRGLLFSVQPADPLTMLGAALLMFAIALAAAIGPARRATRTDPILCLKQE